MAPLISIIIPVYNAEKYLEETVDSCVRQSYKNIEIIVINDGSTDNSENIILTFTDHRIKYFKINNSGPCNARNFGISVAKGDLFQFLDHDDVLDHDKLQQQMKRYERSGNNFVYSSQMGSIVGNRKFLEKGFSFYYKNLDFESYYTMMFKNFGKYLVTGVWLIPKKVLQKTHGWDEKSGINDDGEYFSRIIAVSKGIIFCPGSTFYFRRDVEMSLSKQFGSKEVYEKWLYSYVSYKKVFENNLDPKIAKKLGRRALSVFYCNSYPNFPDLLEECKQEINMLGYKSPFPYGGKLFKLIATFIGVDKALKIRSFKDGYLS